MNAHTRRRRKSRRTPPQFHSSNACGVCDRCGARIGEHLTGDYWCPTGARPARDIFPVPPRPLIERPLLAHNACSTCCQHGVAWEHWCDRCERGEITRAIDTQLTG